MTNKQQVREGFFLHYPEAGFHRDERSRGGPGTVVDLDAPLEDVWCAGQLHKLEPAPVEAAVTPIGVQRGVQMRAEYIKALSAPSIEPKGDLSIQDPDDNGEPEVAVEPEVKVEPAPEVEPEPAPEVEPEPEANYESEAKAEAAVVDPDAGQLFSGDDEATG